MSELAYRDVTILDLKDRDAEIEFPERILLRFDKGLVDVGSLCYRTVGRRRSDRPNDGAQVDLSSFDRKRVPIVLTLIELARSSTLAVSSTRDQLTAGIRTARWMLDRGLTLNTPEEVVRALTQLSYVLTDDVRRLDRKYHSANRERTEAIKLCAALIGEDPVQLEWSVPPVQGKQVKVEAPSSDSRNRNVHAYLHLFMRISSCLMKGDKFPIYIDFRPIIDEHPAVYIYSSNQRGEKKHASVIFSHRGVPASFDELYGIMYETEGYERADIRRAARASLQHLFETLERSNEPFSAAKFSSVNLALTAYYLTFIAISGVNIQVADGIQELDDQPSERFDFDSIEVDSDSTLENRHAQKGQTFVGVKGRAGGKTVYPTIGKLFYTYHQKYLEFRSWVEETYKLDLGNKLFFSLEIEGATFGNSNQRQFTDKEVRFGSQGPERLNLFKCFMERHTEGFEWLSPQKLRKALAVSTYDITPEPEKVARKLQNRVETTISAYTAASRKDGNISMTEFINAIHNVAITIGRNTSDKIPVSIIEKASFETPVGGCNVPDSQGAELQEGFNQNSVQPDCGAAETCFFCKHYALHAAENDIHNLLSIRQLIESAKPRGRSVEQAEATFAPIIYRIDEILQHIVAEHPECETLIADLRARVEDGELSEFWQTHHDYMIDLEGAA